MDAVYTQLSRYTQPAIIVLGTVGFLFNQLLFFSRKQLRSTSCSLYFRALSINDLLVLYLVVLPQWLRDQFSIDPTRQNNWYCKMSTYLTYSLYTLSPYFIVLACFDRLCTSSTNARLRRIAAPRVAAYLIPSAAVVVFLAYCHVPIWFSVVGTPMRSFCTVTNYNYYLVFAQCLLIISCLAPPILMLVLCVTTLLFLRRQRRRVMPVNQARLRQRDNQLLKMLLIYVASNIVCFAPFTITLFLQVYRIVGASRVYNTWVQLLILWVNANYATSFYLYTLATPFYRDELHSLVRSACLRIARKTPGVPNS